MALSTVQLASMRLYLADPGTSAQQAILIDNALTGTFTVSFDGQTTTAIPYPAGSNVLQNALAALSNIGLGNISVVNDSPYAVYFGGDLASAAQPMLTVDDSNLIGPNVLSTVSQVVAGGIQAFSDDELNGLYSDGNSNFFLAVSFGFRVLMSNAAKFVTYVAGQTREEKDKIFDHLAAMAELYQTWAYAGQQILLTSLVPVPPRERAWPYPNPARQGNLNVTPGNRALWRRGWGGWGW